MFACDLSEQNMQNHRNASFESNDHEIFPGCDKNHLSGDDCHKFQDTEEACRANVIACSFTLIFSKSGAMETSGIEQKFSSKALEKLHLNSSIKSEDDCIEQDVCESSSANLSGFCFDIGCSKPLTSTPCSGKKRVSFQLAEDCRSMDDSGYDGSPTSEQKSPIVSRRGNVEVSRYADQDSYEEENLSPDFSNPRFSLLSRFDEPDRIDSGNTSFSSSKSNSSLTHLASDRSVQLEGSSRDKEKAETGHGIVWPQSAKNIQFSTETAETAHTSSSPTAASFVLSQNSEILPLSSENAEIFHTSPEKSVYIINSSNNRPTSRCHLPNDSGFVEELSDLLDARLNISDLNVASIFYANSPEFSLARKVMSAKEYDDRLVTMLRHFAPPCLDRLIGRKMGLDKVDVISELYFRSATGVLSAILNYLSDDDLQSMCDVSKHWKATVKSISSSRYKKHRRRQKPSRRNEQIDRENDCVGRIECRSVTNAPQPLLQVQSIEEVRVSTKQRVPDRTERFWQEASKLKNHESLRKCPRCQSPARADAAQERAWCCDSKCLYDFCIRCLAPFHSLQPCVGAKHRQSSKSRLESKICGGQSKRNLRRL